MSNIKWSQDIRITMYKLLKARVGVFDHNLWKQSPKHISNSDYTAHLTDIANILTETYEQEFTASKVRSQINYVGVETLTLKNAGFVTNMCTNRVCALAAGFITVHELIALDKRTVHIMV